MRMATDGRAARWEAHNAERRRELVASSLRAIRKHGANVGMDHLAAEANTSKTVFYRHFGDRAGLYQAIVDWVRDYIVERLPLADSQVAEPAMLIRELADAYLALVEKDPEIYQFVITRPSSEVADPVLGITTRIGNEVSAAMAGWLRRNNLDTEAANTWGHGIVGFVWAVADRWIITNLRRPREDVVAYIESLFTPAFVGSIAPVEPIKRHK